VLKANARTVRKSDAWAATQEDAALASDVVSRVACTAIERVALRHHLDTLILKLAAAQAGSVDAAKESRRHAEAVREMLIGSDERACEHVRLAGVSETADGWECEGCGARWPGGLVAIPARDTVVPHGIAASPRVAPRRKDVPIHARSSSSES
jgi:hypothetical protein